MARKSTALILALILAGTLPALGRWRAEYAAVSPELQKWFNSLRSPQGTACCDVSDGHRIDDADVDTAGGHYRVRLGGIWHKVDPERVLTIPNRLGQPVVWFLGTEQDPRITCFLPGAGF